jgi:nucleoside-diphosphate-sugar epimerase
MKDLSANPLPASISSEEELDELLSRPTPALVRSIGQLKSPLVVLGAGGKMGPSLCVLARRAAAEAGHELNVVAVSRFSDSRVRSWLESRAVQTVSCDLLKRQAIEALPDCENLTYLVGLKFGTSQNPSLTWAVNTVVPSLVAQRYPRARIVALSTGNVYPFVPVASGGATESDGPAPIGEYAAAALARERILEHYSRTQGTPTVLLRLNYAVEMRYGVLAELAQKVWQNEPVDLLSGHFNCIWQGDANEMILRSFPLTATPPAVFNLTGPPVSSVRALVLRVGELMQKSPRFVGKESETALLSNPARLCALLGAPAMPLDKILEWTAQWVAQGGPMLGKPTHFDVRSGKY